MTASTRVPSSPGTAETSCFSEAVWIASGLQGPLVGIVTRPLAALDRSPAVLIVAGQPQTRIGAHRMFVTLARALAARGTASLRFDCGGWGDSPGEACPFEESVDDIVVAAAALRDQGVSPPQATRHGAGNRPWVLLGLCDGASAAVLALDQLQAAGLAPAALCLINPWVRGEAESSQAVQAEAMLASYYRRQLLDLGAWRRLLTGRIGPASLLEPLRRWRRSRPEARKPAGAEPHAARSHASAAADPPPGTDLPERLLASLLRHPVPVWTVLSGNDLTAAETEARMRRDRRWRQRLQAAPSVLLRVPAADHTFTGAGQWHHVIEWIAARCAGRDPKPDADSGSDRRRGCPPGAGA